MVGWLVWLGGRFPTDEDDFAEGERRERETLEESESGIFVTDLPRAVANAMLMKTHGMRFTRPFASRMVVLALLVVPHVAAPGACRPMAFGGSRRDIDEMSTCEVSSAETSAVLNTTAITASLQPATMCWAQRRAWRRVFSTLEAGGVLSVVIIGGSVARGNGCAAEANARFGDEGHRLAVNCAYSARLVRWLRGR